MKKILIDIHQSGTKVCIVEDNELVEFWVEKQNTTKVVGNIYKGKVVNVLPGMQAAFVDIGAERNGFLYAGDTLVDDNAVYSMAEAQALSLRAGDSVLCQVVKDEFGTKGARLTMNLSIPGRILVMMPKLDYIGISKKITDEIKRENLTEIIKNNRNQKFGFIVRTQAEFSDESEIVLEIAELEDKWKRIQRDYLEKPHFSLLFDEDDIITRVMRDMLRHDVDKIIINDLKAANAIVHNFEGVLAKKPDLVEVYDGSENMLGFYGINRQIEKLLKRKVVMKNGAYLIIDRTEALTVIDVNTGKFVGDKNLEETVYKTNKIAAVEIAKQLRLRNIGGIILIDFIDMVLPEHREDILSSLGAELQKDRVKTTLVGMTSLGLVELTRKKARSMIEATLLQNCPYCNGDAYVQSDEFIIMRIKEALAQVFADADPPAVKLYVNPQIFNKLFALRYLESECANEWADKRIYVVPDALMHIERYTLEQEHSMIIELPDEAKMLY